MRDGRAAVAPSFRRRYMRPESLAKARLEVIDGEAGEEVKGELVAAS
jgi:hypothetical protein